MGLNLEEQKAVDRFRTDVVEPSMTGLVIVDFWAEWCGPCKALTPVLEKIAAEYADRGVTLAKINVDEDQFIASQFQVRSIPTVYAMFQGQPVADLTSARSESQLRQAIDQILAQVPIEAAGNPQDGDLGAGDIAQFTTMAEEILADGDPIRAAGVFSQVVQMAPDDAPARAGLVRALLAANETDAARAALDEAPADLAGDPLLAQARMALDLAGTRVNEGELQALRARAAEQPADMDAQYALAEAAFATGARDEAADALLAMVARDADWNEGAAKAKLLQIFEATGLEDPWVSATRRRLSTILFG